MFTGIVEEIGTVHAFTRPDGAVTDAVLTITAPLAASDAHPGDSIAINGACLTVTTLARHDDAAATLTPPPASNLITFDVMPETLRHTTLGTLQPGSPVNVERALPAGGRLGGHIMQGHVDGTATLISRTPGPRWDDLTFTASADIMRYIAHKGSIAINGVSLTVTSVVDDAPAALSATSTDGESAAQAVPGGTFSVSLIPTTLKATTLAALQPGHTVNVEVDVLAKYVERLASVLPAGAVAARAVGRQHTTSAQAHRITPAGQEVPAHVASRQTEVLA